MKPKIASQPASQDQSPFFRLPAEIREFILREAFGGRAVHLELRLQPILRPLSPRKDATNQRSGQQQKAGFLRSLLHRVRPPKFQIKPYHGKGEVTEWRWHGGICRRDVPELCGQRQRPYDRSVPLYQARDDCIAEFARGEAAESQRVGVFGFLLTCKKGYHEALTTLYATNTLIIEYWPSTLAVLRLAATGTTIPPNEITFGPPHPRFSPRIISPGQHLATSLCLRTTFSLWWYGEPQMGEDEDGQTLAEYATHLPRAFPRLRSLVWSVGENLSVPRVDPDSMHVPTREKLERALLGPLMGMRREMAEIREMVVAVPVGIFFELAEEARKAGRGSVGGEREWERHLERVWYPFEGAGPDGKGEDNSSIVLAGHRLLSSFYVGTCA
ncbi:hypothetical protein C8A05DRAFT_37189 [Staphylotrichum tortipilum]|uniref:DUF7730 domain-containing protein n=1 Tax=Staphylotrichum tortipilum TaxID=2831512 RepID=A0AAN6RQY2_9PEZI|nr:hypothetical protein C8A05DRAFT_37189 [Staphylotrichum longicolle]